MSRQTKKKTFTKASSAKSSAPSNKTPKALVFEAGRAIHDDKLPFSLYFNIEATPYPSIFHEKFMARFHHEYAPKFMNSMYREMQNALEVLRILEKLSDESSENPTIQDVMPILNPNHNISAIAPLIKKTNQWVSLSEYLDKTQKLGTFHRRLKTLFGLYLDNTIDFKIDKVLNDTSKEIETLSIKYLSTEDEEELCI